MLDSLDEIRKCCYCWWHSWLRAFLSAYGRNVSRFMKKWCGREVKEARF